MSLLPIVTDFLPGSPLQLQDQVSELPENEVTDAGSFAKALEALTQNSLEQAGIEKDEPETHQVTADIAQHEAEPGEVEVELNIEVDLPIETADTPIPNLFQNTNHIPMHSERPAVVSDEPVGDSVIAEENVSQEAEADPKGKYLPKTELYAGLHIEKGLEVPASPSGLRETNRDNIPSVHFGKDPSQGKGGIPLAQDSERLDSAEVLELKTVEPPQMESTAEPAREGGNKTESFEAGNDQKIQDELFMKSPVRAEIFDTARESSFLVDDEVVTDQGGGITFTKEGMAEGTEIDLEGKKVISQLQSPEPEFEEGLAGQEDLQMSKKVKVLSLPSGETLSQGKSKSISPMNPHSENSNPLDSNSVEELILKNTGLPKVETSSEQIKSEQIKVEAGKTAPLKTEVFTLDALKIPQNENGKNTSAEKAGKAGDAIPVKSPTETGLDHTEQEALSSDAQAGEFQKNQEEAGGTDRRPQLTEDFQKVSSLAQTPILEAEGPEPEMGQTALGSSEKTAILSQLTEQFKVLQPGKVEQVRLSLHPESLGALQVEITLQKGAVVAHIITGDPLIKDLLEGNQSLLRQSLAEQGFEIDGFSVDVGDPEGRFKDRETKHPFFENRRFNPQSDHSPLGELRPGQPVGEQDRISIYV